LPHSTFFDQLRSLVLVRGMKVDFVNILMCHFGKDNNCNEKRFVWLHDIDCAQKTSLFFSRVTLKTLSQFERQLDTISKQFAS